MSSIVGIHADRVSNVALTDFPNHETGEGSWDLAEFKRNLEINVHSLAPRDLNFDLVHVDTSVANAFRRIMLAEVPSVAPEHVYVFNNTLVIADEVLSHRLGLIPLNVDPALLEWVDKLVTDESRFTDKNTLVFTLNVTCSRNTHAPKDATDPKVLYKNAHVYAKDLKWEPQGTQASWPEFQKRPPAPCDPNILLCKLRPGQEIVLRVHCVKGIGADHAKFSPVCTASYRLLPSIKITEEIRGADAVKFQQCFPSGVVAIEGGKAVVVDPRRDTVSREVLRHEEFQGKVELGRVRDHFVFNVETVGGSGPEEVFVQSVRVLREKAEYLRRCQIG